MKSYDRLGEFFGVVGDGGVGGFGDVFCDVLDGARVCADAADIDNVRIAGDLAPRLGEFFLVEVFGLGENVVVAMPVLIGLA